MGELAIYSTNSMSSAQTGHSWPPLLNTKSFSCPVHPHFGHWTGPVMAELSGGNGIKIGGRGYIAGGETYTVFPTAVRVAPKHSAGGATTTQQRLFRIPGERSAWKTSVPSPGVACSAASPA